MAKRISKLFVLLVLVICSCSTVMIEGVYAEPPNKNCVFIKFHREYEDGACWCALNGQSKEGADVMVFAKVADKYCLGD